MNTTTLAQRDDQPRDLFITRAMLQSSQRPPNLLTELSELRELSKLLADDPLLALRYLLQVARHLCNAGSAGVSVLRRDIEGREIIFWEVVSGALATYEGTGLGRNSSPCGLCLDTGATILVSRPERVYSGLKDTQPEIVEDLVVPLCDNARQPLGTLWIAHHDQTSHCCSDDARILEQLSVQAVLAIKLLERSRERRYAVNLLQSYHRAQRDLFEHDLCRERRLRERAQQSEAEARRTLLLKESTIQETHHRVKNTLQVAASVLSSHARATSSEQVRTALLKSQGSLQLLAKAHELLCVTGSGAQSILMPTLLDTLSNALQHSFAAMATRVTLQIIAEPLRLPVDEAIAVAMLANEALTNAYKHAFPGEARGAITLTLYHACDDTLMLRITDDGIGLPPKSTAEGVGLQLVRAFATQLGGVLTVTSGAEAPGTSMTLVMRSPSKRVRRCAEPVPAIASPKPS